jgi:uncharacterized protein (TIGR03435 family)
LTLSNVPVRFMIQRAYEVQPFQIVGGPDWIGSDRFDVTAKAAADASPSTVNRMLQRLLTERFRLVVRREARELPIYNLVKARDDGQPGAGLKPAAIDCQAARGRGPVVAPAPGGAAGRAAPGGNAGRGEPDGRLGGCRLQMAPGRLTGAGQAIAALANALSPQLGRPVIDKTGLSGGYDFELAFMPEGRGMPLGPPPPGAPELPPLDPNAPSLFTALQEQLGLKLESGRGPVEVIVVESLSQPTED